MNECTVKKICAVYFMHKLYIRSLLSIYIQSSKPKIDIVINRKQTVSRRILSFTNKEIQRKTNPRYLIN